MLKSIIYQSIRYRWLVLFLVLALGALVT